MSKARMRARKQADRAKNRFDTVIVKPIMDARQYSPEPVNQPVLDADGNVIPDYY